MSKNKNYGLNKRKKIVTSDNCHKLDTPRGKWSSWSKCSNDCGNGLMKREWIGNMDNYPKNETNVKICVGQSKECTQNFLNDRGKSCLFTFNMKHIDVTYSKGYYHFRGVKRIIERKDILSARVPQHVKISSEIHACI